MRRLTLLLVLIGLVLAGCAPPAYAAKKPVRGTYGSTHSNCGSFNTKAPHRAVYVVGDSITVGARHLLPAMWEVNAKSGRRVDCLQGLLRHRKATSTPDVVIIALGTNTVLKWKLADYRRAVDLFPRSTRVVMVTPYRRNGATVTKRYAGWMRALAKRPNVVLADWRSYALKHPALLRDGTHPNEAGHRQWARIVTNAARR